MKLVNNDDKDEKGFEMEYLEMKKDKLDKPKMSFILWIACAILAGIFGGLLYVCYTNIII